MINKMIDRLRKFVEDECSVDYVDITELECQVVEDSTQIIQKKLEDAGVKHFDGISFDILNGYEEHIPSSRREGVFVSYPKFLDVQITDELQSELEKEFPEFLI